MEKKSQNFFTQKVTPPIIIAGIIGVITGFMVPWLAASGAIDLFVSASPFTLIIAFFPVLFLVIVIHELGHVCGGWITGQQFYMLAIGPLHFIRRSGRIKIQLIFRTGLMGGCVCLPKSMGNLIRSRLILLAMGPVFNLLAAAIFGVAGLWLRNITPIYSDLSVLTAIFSLIIGVINFIPTKSGGFQTDGAQLITLIKKGAAADEMVNIFHLQNLLISGTRPRDIDPNLFGRGFDIPSTNDNYSSILHLLAYYHHLDSGDIEKAKAHLDKSVENYDGIPKGVRQSFALEVAFFAVFYNDDFEIAGEWMKRSKGGFDDGLTRARVEAALAAVKGDVATTRKKLSEAQKALLKAADKGSAYLEKDLLEQIETKLIKGGF